MSQFLQPFYSTRGFTLSGALISWRKKIRSLKLDHNFRTLRIIEKRNLTKFFSSLFFKIKWGSFLNVCGQQEQSIELDTKQAKAPGGYSGFQVMGTIEWGQSSNPPKIQGSNPFLNKNFKDFSRTFKDTIPIFQGLHSVQKRALTPCLFFSTTT